jgi:hypothetical protein
VMRSVRRANRGVRKIWLIEPLECRGPGDLSRAVVQAVTRKEAEDLIFHRYKGDRFKVRFEELAVLEWSIVSYVICVQLVPTQAT